MDEQIVRRLKEECVGFDNQLHAIERTLKAKEHDYEELLLLSHDAYHAKEMAQAELHRFEQGVMGERNQRDKEVQEKKALVQQRVEMNQRLEQREKLLRQQQDLDRAGELALKTTTAMAELASSMSHNEAEEEKLRMQEFEDAFRRIKEATGVLDVNEVIQKFLTQEEKEKMKSLVDELKYSAAGGAARRQIGEDLESHLNEAQAKCDRNRGKFERIAKVLIDVKAGVDHIGANLSPIKLDGEAPIEIRDAQTKKAKQQAEEYQEKMLAKSQSDIRIRKAKQQAEEYQEKMLAKSQ